MRYRDAGVDVDRSDALKQGLLDDVTSTWTPTVRRLRGGFAGVMAWPGDGGRLLAATMDGVGTKLHVAMAVGRVADAAADLVAHGADDLLAHGARPLAFLDYIAQARLDPDVVREAVRGLARGCRAVGAVLLGGETAEMPDTYVPGVVDVAGCMLGWVDERAMLDGSRVEPGDVLLGLAADGLHTNGFSLARRVVASSGLGLGDRLPRGGGETLGDALLAPHRAYGPALLPEVGGDRVHALAHVTGGGLASNLVRALPEGRRAILDRLPPRSALLRWLIDAGAIPADDARRAFNLGVGMVVVAAADRADALAAHLERRGERVTRLGRVVAGARDVEWQVQDE